MDLKLDKDTGRPAFKEQNTPDAKSSLRSQKNPSQKLSNDGMSERHNSKEAISARRSEIRSSRGVLTHPTNKIQSFGLKKLEGKATYKDLPPEIQMKILLEAADDLQKIPALALVDRESFELASAMPEMPPRQRALKESIKELRGNAYVETLEQNRIVVQKMKDPLCLPQDLQIEQLIRVARLVQGTKQKPIFVSERKSHVLKELGPLQEHIRVMNRAEYRGHLPQHLRDLYRLIEDMQGASTSLLNFIGR